MTVLEMHDAIRLGLDKPSSLMASFEPEELDYWVNEAQIQLVKQKMFGNNVRQESYDYSAKRADDLNILSTTSDQLIFGVSAPGFRKHPYIGNVALIDVDDTLLPNYMFYLSSTLTIEGYGDISQLSPFSAVTTILITEEDSKKLITTPFNVPYLKESYVYLKNDQINVVFDPEIELASLFVEYIRTPQTLVRSNPGVYEVTTCELPEQIHPEIVALTVKLLLENIESPRVQTNEFELSRKE